MSKITFADKSQTGSYDAAKVNAQDLNEIKNSVNAIYDNPGGEGVIEFAEFSINHTNGVADNYGGIGTPISTSIGAGSDGSGNLVLTPASTYWRSLNIPAVAINLEVRSNIVSADLAGAFNPDAIVVYLKSANLTGINSATSSQIRTVFLRKNDATPSGGLELPGVLNSPNLVRDSLTVYGNDNTTGLNYNIGTGGTFSNYYFTFGISIPASAATKIYKFKIYLTYQ